jgi:hypothetical protein
MQIIRLFINRLKRDQRSNCSANDPTVMKHALHQNSLCASQIAHSLGNVTRQM